jgi:hypothetical protein
MMLLAAQMLESGYGTERNLEKAGALKKRALELLQQQEAEEAQKASRGRVGRAVGAEDGTA